MEDFFEKSEEKLKMFETATLVIKNQHSFMYKEDIEKNLLQSKETVGNMLEGSKYLKLHLKELKEGNERCKEMLSTLKTLEEKLIHMENNIPTGIKDFLKLQETEEIKNGYANHKEKENISIVSNGEVFTPDAHLSIKDCKKSLFKEVEVYPLITPVTQEEFTKIPKYIIGRQTLAMINSLITTINQILKAKYTLLSLGKNGARKKGDLDSYLEFKKQQTSVEEGEGKIYFFTAEDYLKHTSSKLDKIKLNMLTALRSCRKLREIRIGKSLFYMVVTN